MLGIKYQYIIIIATALWVTACGPSKRNFETTGTVPQVSAEYLANAADSLFNESATEADWWTNFNDPVLDTLIESAKAHNRNIETAVAHFYAARATRKGVKFDRFPTVTANGNYTRQQLGEVVFSDNRIPPFGQINGTFDAFWETNLFGRVTAKVQAARAGEQVALADMQALYVSVFAEVARNYTELRGVQFQLDIARRNLENQQETFDIVQRLAKAGESNTLDLARAEAQLEATRATIPPLKARLVALSNALSTLTGTLPGTLDDEVIRKKPLPTLPTSVLVGQGNQLLARRPDVRRATYTLQGAIAQYNLSVASLYPEITFNGALGFSAINFENFGQTQSFTWTLLPSISWPAFNLGRVRQQIAQRDALALGALSDYEQTVLMALEEVKTAMANYQNELQRRATLRLAFEASAKAELLAQQRFEAGLDSFLDYLNADQALLQAEVALANSEIAAVTGLIAIYKALGGGWEIVLPEDIEEKFDNMKASEGTF